MLHLEFHTVAEGLATAAYPGLDRTLIIHGSRGSIEVVDDELIHWRIAGETQEAEIDEEVRPENVNVPSLEGVPRTPFILSFNCESDSPP